LSAARRIADQARLEPADDWAATALAAFEHLRDTGAYAHLDGRAAVRCTADPSAIRGWLTGPSDLPGLSTLTVADTWLITEDDFHWEADAIAVRIATLVEQAQAAGLFGAPGYRVTLRHVSSGDPDDDPILEHEVTLTGPTGVVYASDPIPTDHLTDDLSGVDGAIAALTNTAAVVDELLMAEQQLLATAVHTAASPDTPRPWRGFTALDLTTPATTPTSPPTPPGITRGPTR
jgi:hypothetical protein